MQTKIIGVLNHKGTKQRFPKERIEKIIRVILGFDIRLEIVPIDTPTIEEGDSSNE